MDYFAEEILKENPLEFILTWWSTSLNSLPIRTFYKLEHDQPQSIQDFAAGLRATILLQYFFAFLVAVGVIKSS